MKSKYVTYGARRFSKKFIKYAIVIWSAFLAASIGFFLVFAFVDPKGLGEILTFPVSWSHLTGYGVGFALLFLVAILSSFFTLVLLKKNPKRNSQSKTDQL